VTPTDPNASPEPSATPQPTAGPTPTLPAPLVVLVLPAETDAERSKEYQTAVYNLAQSAGYRFQVLPKFTSEDMALVRNLKIVIAMPPDPGVAALAASAPDVQFLTIGIDGIKAGGNVSVLGGNSLAIDKIAFMAGYIGAMLTENFHTGVILRKGSPDAEKISTAFRAGQIYFCGLCNPTVPPFKDYPLRMDIPEDAKPKEYTAYADLLIRDKVDTMFLQPGMDTPELLEYLPTVGVLMIGTKSPIKKPGVWIVTLQSDYMAALKTAWPDLVAGKGGQDFPAPLAFTDINPDLFSPGKQILAQKVLDDVLAGLISTEIPPAQ
jgi:hypothetical protein